MVIGDNQFIWQAESQLSRRPREVPDANIEHIAPTELRAIVITSAMFMFGSTREELIVETARKLGFTRTGVRIREVLNATIDQLLIEGKLLESFGNIHASDIT